MGHRVLIYGIMFLRALNEAFKHPLTGALDVAETGQRPMDLLGKSLTHQVLVKLKGDRELRGRLRGYDQHLNLILDEAEDLTNGKPQELGTVIVRGDNVILLSPSIKNAPRKTEKGK
jgi:small nuclear ribonucleoprotein